MSDHCLSVLLIIIADGVVGAGTITSPWTPVSAGPLGPADLNGDSKHLDVGDMSDVSTWGKVYDVS